MPNEELAALEKKLEKLRSKPDSSELVIALNDISLACIHSDPQKAKIYALEAYDIANVLGIKDQQAKSNLLLGLFYLEAGDFNEAQSQCRAAMQIYESIEDKHGIAAVHSRLANIFLDQGLIDKALEHFLMSLKKKQECDVGRKELATFYFNVGVCYATLDRLELAMSFYEHARSVWEESGERTHLACLYHNIGTVFGKKEEHENAREYYQKSLDIREDLGEKRGIASALNNLGMLRDKLGDYESALDYYVRSLELYEALGHRRDFAYACVCAGSVYTKLGRLEEAEKLIMKGLEITRELKIKDVEIHCLEKTTDFYEAKGDLQKALMYSRELKTCLEEYLNEKSMEKIAVLQVQFETEKKEKEAEIYRLKNVELSSMNDELRDALAHVNRLQGMLPICSNCKKVRDDDGYWQQIESYISEHSEARITHGICPECMIKLYGKDFTRPQPAK